LGCIARSFARRRRAVEGAARPCLPHRRAGPVSALHRYVAKLAQAPTRLDGRRSAAGRRALACGGGAAKSAVLPLLDDQRTGRLPRVLLALLHQRARAALLGATVSEGLQHGPATLFLGRTPAVAVPLQRVPASGRAAALPLCGPRRTRAHPLPVLARVRTD